MVVAEPALETRRVASGGQLHIEDSFRQLSAGELVTVTVTGDDKYQEPELAADIYPGPLKAESCRIEKSYVCLPYLITATRISLCYGFVKCDK